MFFVQKLLFDLRDLVCKQKISDCDFMDVLRVLKEILSLTFCSNFGTVSARSSIIRGCQVLTGRPEILNLRSRRAVSAGRSDQQNLSAKYTQKLGSLFAVNRFARPAYAMAA